MHHIVLHTDFGLQDPYVGVMKGVISSISPSANIIDLNHNIQPFNIKQASYELRYSHTFFKPGSIFVSIVDPGVGSNRKIICVKSKDYIFLAPDNGLLSETIKVLDDVNIYSVENPKLFLNEISNTFHGRDILSPAAAHLLNGVDPGELGQKLSLDELHKLEFIQHYKEGLDNYLVEIVKEDNFGNLTTSLNISELRNLKDISVQTSNCNIEPAETYSLTKPLNIIAYKNSDGHLEIGAREGKASNFITADTIITIKRRSGN